MNVVSGCAKYRGAAAMCANVWITRFRVCAASVCACSISTVSVHPFSFTSHIWFHVTLTLASGSLAGRNRSQICFWGSRICLRLLVNRATCSETLITGLLFGKVVREPQFFIEASSFYRAAQARVVGSLLTTWLLFALKMTWFPLCHPPFFWRSCKLEPLADVILAFYLPNWYARAQLAIRARVLCLSVCHMWGFSKNPPTNMFRRGTTVLRH